MLPSSGFSFRGSLTRCVRFLFGLRARKSTPSFLELDNLIQKITHTELTQTRVENAKNLLVGQQQISQQRIQNRAMGYCVNHVLDLPFDQHLHLAKRLREITAQDLKRVATKIFSQARQTRVLVGQCPPSWQSRYQTANNF